MIAETHLFRSIGAGVLCILIAQTVSGTTFAPVDFSELVTSSQQIVHGTVIDTKSRWVDDHSIIVTDVQIDIAETIKGQHRKRIQFTHLGGKVGKLRVEVPGASAFRHGEEVILFMNLDDQNHWRLTGGDQGRFDIIEDKESHKKWVRSRMSMDKHQPGNNQVQMQPETIERFLSRVRHQVDEPPTDGGK